MDIEKLKSRYASLINEAKTKAAEFGDEPMPKEKADEITGLLGQADEIKAQIDAMQRISAGEAYLDEPAGTKAAHLGFRQSGPGEGDADVDEKAWRELEVKAGPHYNPIIRKVRYNVPVAVQKKGYSGAFEGYLRKGFDGVGPNDRKALTEATDSAGGYLVPEDMQAGIIAKVATIATVRMFARVIQTSRDIAKLTRRKYTANNQYTAGGRLTWTGETPSSSTVHRVTDQVYGEINAPVHTAMASQLISRDLLEDAAFDVQGDSEQMLSEAFGLGENATFWTGTGANQPRGMLIDLSDTTNWDAAIYLAATADTFTADEVIEVAYALPAQYERNARWFMTKSTEKTVRQLKGSDNNYLWPIVTQVGGLGVAERELLGFPTERDEFMHNVSDSDNTTTYPLVLGDLMGYTVVDRVGLSIQRNDFLYMETNQVLLLGRKRVGGQLLEAYKFSLLRTVNST